jgi:hypothetical protein
MQAKRIREQRWRPPSDALVLAAADRARRHRDGSERGATLAAIADHLGMTWGPHASRRLRPIVDRLASELGWLQHSRWQSRDYWALTSTGSERLSRAMVEGIAEELPESPQHREWRRLREHAAARIETLRAELGELLAEVNAMIDAEQQPSTAAWLKSAKRLNDTTVAIGVASYCLYEHPEPDDARADHHELIDSSGNLVSWRYPRLWDPGHDA